MTGTRGPRPPANGFTLVELLVSLTLMTMTAMLLMAALWAGRSVSQRGQSAVSQGESVAAAQGLLRDRVEHLSSGTDGLSTSASGAVKGDGATISFVAPPIASRAPSAPLRYLVGVARDGTLDLASIDAQARGPAAARSRWTVMPLIDDVRAIELAYFGATGADRVARWRSSWTNQSDPPQLIRLRLRFAAGDVRRWPDLVIRPEVTVSAACRVNPTTGECGRS